MSEKKPYTILKRGVEEDGSTWADYIDDVGDECHIKVMAGLDLEERIARAVQNDREDRELLASMTPEQRARNLKLAADADRRWGPCRMTALIDKLAEAVWMIFWLSLLIVIGGPLYIFFGLALFILCPVIFLGMVVAAFFTESFLPEKYRGH